MTGTMRCSHWIVSAALLVAGLQAPGVAQELPADVYMEEIDVRVINLEAVVTDRDGVRVSRLQSSDFKLLVDGEPVPIEYFTEIRDREVIDSANGVPQLTVGERVGTSFLVFIDEFFALPTDKKRVLEALSERARELGPEDQAAIVAWDGKRLVLLSEWTSSREALAEAFRNAVERGAGGLAREAERRSWLGTTATRAGRGVFIGGRRYDAFYNLAPEENRYAMLLTDQLNSAVGAAAAAIRGLDTPTGRKVMMLLSGGWPWDPAQWVSGSSRRMINEPGIPRGADIYAPLSTTANLLGYTIYAVDMPGLQAAGVDAFSRAPRPVGVGDSAFFLEREMEFSLHYLADETGGRSLLNGERIAALPEVGRDVTSYYWLGFSPTWAKDGETHEIRIEVANPELEVRARQSFTDLSPQQQAAFLVQSTLLFGGTRSTGGMQVELGEPEKAGRGKLQVPVKIVIPISELEAARTADGYLIEVDLFIAARDEAGGRSDVIPVPLVFQSREAPAAPAIIYETTLTVRKKTEALAIAAFDRHSGRTLTAVLEKGS